MKPFNAQNNCNMVLQSFSKRCKELSILNQFEHFVKAALCIVHCDQFCQFSKRCHFWNIRCFLKLFFFPQNDSNVLLQSFFNRVIELSFFNQFEHFVRAIAYAL